LNPHTEPALGPPDLTQPYERTNRIFWSNDVKPVNCVFAEYEDRDVLNSRYESVGGEGGGFGGKQYRRIEKGGTQGLTRMVSITTKQIEKSFMKGGEMNRCLEANGR